VKALENADRAKLLPDESKETPTLQRAGR
jgi:hypothetical protein